METLNMSKLNLSSVRNQNNKDMAVKIDTQVMKHDPSFLVDDEVYSEYDDDVWNNLLEQDNQRETIHFRSPQLEFRGTLVQQLRDATRKLGYTMATLHVAVAQLDLFMDAHRLRSDRLTDVALACLSLAAKTEEKLSQAPTLKSLSKVSGLKLCGKTFRQLEWMVGQHARWRLLAPTPVSFAALLAQYVVMDEDLTTRHPKFVRRLRRDGAKLLEAYLDLSLSDVRLKAASALEVGCACVACARAAAGLRAWPPALVERTKRLPAAVTPLASLLQRMMEMISSRDKPVETSDVDQGYSSARTSPSLTPCASPTSSESSITDTYRHNAIEHITTDPTYVDNEVEVRTSDVLRVPSEKVANSIDYKFCRSRRMIEASLGNDMKAVKRSCEDIVEVEKKRSRLSNQDQAVGML